MCRHSLKLLTILTLFYSIASFSKDIDQKDLKNLYDSARSDKRFHNVLSLNETFYPLNELLDAPLVGTKGAFILHFDSHVVAFPRSKKEDRIFYYNISLIIPKKDHKNLDILCIESDNLKEVKHNESILVDDETVEVTCNTVSKNLVGEGFDLYVTARAGFIDNTNGTV